MTKNDARSTGLQSIRHIKEIYPFRFDSRNPTKEPLLEVRNALHLRDLAVAAARVFGRDSEHARRSAQSTVRDQSGAIADSEMLWRYMELPKFEDLLKTSTLYFARADQFVDDPFEGRLSPVTRNNFLRALIVAFNFALGRGYCMGNPAEQSAKAKEIQSAVGILTVEQTARLLESAAPELLPYIAIGAFAGLRRAELERITGKKSICNPAC